MARHVSIVFGQPTVHIDSPAGPNDREMGAGRILAQVPIPLKFRHDQVDLVQRTLQLHQMRNIQHNFDGIFLPAGHFKQ